MAKVKIYLRISDPRAGRGPKVAADTLPNYRALETSNGEALPTALMALTLDIPDAEFHHARIQLEAAIKETRPAVFVRQTTIETTNAGDKI